MIETVLVLVLTAHLLAANLAGAAPLVCIWLDSRETRLHDRLAGAIARYLARAALVWLSVALMLGGLMLAILWFGGADDFYQTAGRLPAARFWWAVPELAFYYICVGLYLWLGRTPGARSATNIWLRRGLAIFAATNLLYHFPLLFTVIGVYGTRFTEDGPLEFRRAMADPEVLALFVHHLLASFAVVGVAMMGFALRAARRGAGGDAARAAIWGGRVALVPTVLQLFVGLCVLLTLPERSRARLMGDDSVATALFIISLVGAIMLMHRLASVALGEVERRNMITAMGLLVLVVMAMVGTQQRARREQLVVGGNLGRKVTAPQAVDLTSEEDHSSTQTM